jgi:cbb3-type cytochrome oxidase subunit 3
MGKSALFLAVTLVFLVIFGAIVVRIYRRGRKEEVERPKHRMLEDD